MGKLHYAIKCFEEAVAINDELETLSLLATAYTQANRLDDARITLDRMATCLLYTSIRLEDDILITSEGSRFTGEKRIPITIEEVETIMNE